MSEWGMMKVTGDKEQSAAKRAQQGYEEAEMFLCVCVYMSDSGVLRHPDCPSPLLFSVHLSPPYTLPYSFPSPCALPNFPSFHLPTSYPSSTPLPLYVSISGSTLVQSLLVGLLARFPSGHRINSLLLTLTQPGLKKGWSGFPLISSLSCACQSCTLTSTYTYKQTYHLRACLQRTRCTYMPSSIIC